MTAKSATRNYATINAELAEILAWFESSEIDIDQAAAKYEKGMELVAELEKCLQQAENRVEKIKQKFDKTATA